MSKDEATVARMAKAIYDKDREIFELVRVGRYSDLEHATILAEAALTALPPPDAGVVAALEDLIHQVEGLKQEDAESFDLDQARKALSAHREGNPWSDEVPTEPGLYWWHKEPQHSSRACIIYNMYSGGSDIPQVRFFGTADGLAAADIKGQWCGPLTPPKGGDT